MSNSKNSRKNPIKKIPMTHGPTKIEVFMSLKSLCSSQIKYVMGLK